jgi:AcrR family transcriptional regulator
VSPSGTAPPRRVDRTARIGASEPAAVDGGYEHAHRSELQRRRIHAAVISVVDAHGYDALTVSDIHKTARLSRKTFYQQFTSVNDCLRSAVEETVTSAERRARRAWAIERHWQTAVRAGLLALLEFFDERPPFARVAIIHSHRGGREAALQRSAILERLTDVIDDGGAEARNPPPRTTAEATVAGVLGVIHTRLTSPAGENLTDLLNPLMSFIVEPYRGPAAARGELERPPPQASDSQRWTGDTDLWVESGLRMTYRRIRVIDAIASRPGLSNAQVAERAGISDEGQVSKLLARLQAAGVAEKVDEGRQRGGRNAWHLTPRGKRLAKGTGRETSRAPHGRA